MGEGAAEADSALKGRALPALAERRLYHRADAISARGFVQEALDVLADATPEIRFEPLRVASEIAQWVGDAAEFERYAKDAIAPARAAERTDLEALVIHPLVTVYVIK